MLALTAWAELWQHALVTLVAVLALGIVLKRVVGVFESRPPGGPARPGAAAGASACAHCASGAAATAKHDHRR